MANSNILQEYLVSLGFIVDEPSGKKAGSSLKGVADLALNVAKAAVGAGAAVQTFVAVYAYQMEKLYYSSKRAGTTVDSLQALEFGMKQVGGSGDAMRGAIEGMAAALRSQPGLIAFLNNMGIETQGRDSAEVFMELIEKLKALPVYQAEQVASMFSIDPQTLFTMSQGLDQMKAAQALRRQMSAEAGVDMDAAAKAGAEYTKVLGEMWERMGLLKDMLGMKLLPYFKEWGVELNTMLGDLTKIIGLSKTFTDFWDKIGDWMKTGNPNGGVKLTPEARQRLDAMGEKEPKAGTYIGRVFQEAARVKRENDTRPKASGESQVRAYGDSRSYDRAPQSASEPRQGATKQEVKGAGDAAALFMRLEEKYRLPAGLLDRIWKTESNRGDPKFMKSGAGAKGHFQFMDATAKDYNLQDPNDLGESARAASQFMSRLLKKYDGDLRKAAAAYNWGPGNVDKYGLGRAPKETRDYMDKVAGPEGHTINQTNNVTISGVSDPERAVSKWADEQDRTNSVLVRDLKQRVY